MGRTFPMFFAVYCLNFTCTVSSFEVSQIQYEFLFEGKLNCNWILDKQEDLYFLTCTQMCRRNSECFGIALGHLKENDVDYRRICYLLKKMDESEQYCTTDENEDDVVQIYQIVASSTTTDEPITTTELTTTKQLSRSPETTPLSDDSTTTTEKNPERDGRRVIAECLDYPERKVIVRMKSSSKHFLSGGSITTDCVEPFMMEDVSSSKTSPRPFRNENRYTFVACNKNEVFAGIEICYSDGKINYNYSYVKCKKISDQFFLNVDDENPVTNENEPAEIRCHQGKFIAKLTFILMVTEGPSVYIFCGTLEKNANHLT